MPANQILDSSLLVRLDLGNDAVEHNLAFAANSEAKGNLARRLLVYDTVLIPTTDCGIVPTLVEWLGVEVFSEAVSSGGISFVRRHGLISYVGNGNGISTIVIGEGSSGKKFEWWQEAMFGDLDVALDQQIRNRLPALSPTTRQALHDASRAQLRAVEYTNDFFIRNIVEETYRDITESPKLSSVIASALQGHASVDLARLPGVGPDQVYVLGRQGIQGPIDLVLRVADLNLELVACAQVGGADLLTAEGSQSLLQQKVARLQVGQNAVEGFMRLIVLNGLPDVGAAVAAGAFSLEEVWRVRQTGDATRFRQWLQTIAATDADAIVRAYLEVLHREPRSARWPTKLIRLALTTALGLKGDVLGVASGAADTFVADRLLAGYSPRLFLNQLDKLDLPSEQ
jgi:hypothetical protein